MKQNIIVFGVEKGGASKTTSSTITAYLLAKMYEDEKILFIDMDGQANATNLFSIGNESIGRGKGETIYDLIMNNYKQKLTSSEINNHYIQHVTDNLHIINGDRLLNQLPQEGYGEIAYGNNDDPNVLLKNALESIQDEYRYIIIDTPPGLGLQLINSLAAATDVIIMSESSQFGDSAIDEFLETLSMVQETINPSISVAGVAPNIVDRRRKDNKELLQKLRDTYGDAIFNTIIYRRAETGRIAKNGFTENRELKRAIEPYVDWVEELVGRLS